MSVKQQNNMMTRREMLKRAPVAVAGALAAPMINRGRYRLFADSPAEYSARAIELVSALDRHRHARRAHARLRQTGEVVRRSRKLYGGRLSAVQGFGHQRLSSRGRAGRAERLRDGAQFFATWNGFHRRHGRALHAHRQRGRSRPREKLGQDRRSARPAELRALSHARTTSISSAASASASRS